jgi:uncharacterized protein YkwD
MNKKTGVETKTNILRKWLIAHKHNNHRPHLTRSKSLLVIMFLVLSLQVFSNVLIAKKPSVLGYATDINASTIISLTNSYRSGGGLSSLSYNQALTNAAAAKANDMLSSQYWAHDNPNGTTPWYFFNAAGYSYSYAGENLAKDFNTSAGVLSGWMNSPGHKANIMNGNYTNIGVAVINGTLLGSQTTLVVALYGTPVGVNPAPTPAPAPPPAPVYTPPTHAPTPAPVTTVKPTPAPVAKQNTQTSNTQPSVEKQPDNTPSANQGSQLNKDLNLVKEFNKDTGGFVTVSTPKENINYKRQLPNINLLLSSSSWPTKIAILLLITLALVMLGEVLVRIRDQIHHDRHFTQPLAQASLIIIAIIMLSYSFIGNVL